LNSAVAWRGPCERAAEQPAQRSDSIVATNERWVQCLSVVVVCVDGASDVTVDGDVG
jgi:hypothetical protein